MRKKNRWGNRGKTGSRKKKFRVNGGMLAAAAVTCSLCGMGCAYAAWSKELKSRIHLTTDTFSMAVSDLEEPVAYLLDADGEIAETYSAVLADGMGEKQGNFRIQDGIFAELLSMGGSLRLEFPITCREEDAHWNVGASLVEQEAELKPEQVLFLSGGDVFALPEPWSEPFEKSIPCQIRTETVQQEEQIFGAVTITPKDSKTAFLADCPETLQMTEEEFARLIPVDSEYLGFQLDLEYSDGEHIGTDTGIAVVYSLDCSLYLDQAGAGEEEVELE